MLQVAAALADKQWRPRLLREVYEQYDEMPLIEHWMEYSDAYDMHLPKPDGHTPIKMLEIGVQSGGSARVWKQFYGKPLKYVGIDIEKKCKRTESPRENIFVEIGNQLDGAFLSSVCAKHGPFDIVIDDGGHSAWMMQTSLAHMWNHSDACLSESATYVIEDMHTMVGCANGYCERPADVTDVVSNAFYGMHAHWWTDSSFSPRWLSRGMTPNPVPAPWAAQVRSISLYDSMAFFKRGKPIQSLRLLRKGRDQIAYGRGELETRRQRSVLAPQHDGHEGWR